jgi:predicted component of type VI protein secretion system
MNMESRNTELNNIRIPSEEQSRFEDLNHERLGDSCFEGTRVQDFNNCYSVNKL